MGHFVDDRCGMQQGLGRNAADVEADAAEAGVALDQHGIQADVGGAEGSGVAARARAQHDHFAFDVGRLAAGQRRLRCRRLGRGAVRRGHRRLAGRRSGGRSRCRGLGRGFGGAFGFQHHDHGAFGQAVAQLDLQFLDHAGGRGRHFQGGLVRFQGHQTLILLHRVADGDQHFDHRHIAVIADVGNLDFNRGHGGFPHARPAWPAGCHCICSRGRARGQRPHGGGEAVPYSSTRRMSASTCDRYVVKRAARAPSMTRWS